MEIRRCTEADIPAVQEAFATVYPRSDYLQDRAHFDWQFRDHPLNRDGSYTLFVARDGDAVRGFYGYVPAGLIHDGEPMTACEPTRWWVAEGAGFHGLALFERVTAPFDYRLFYRCSEHSRPLFDRLGMPRFLLPRLIGVIDTVAAESLFPGARPTALTPPEAGDPSRGRSTTAPSREGLSFGQWPAIRTHLRLDNDYLRWRYVDIPGTDYRFLTCNGAAPGEGAVYRVEQILGHPYSVLRLQEWTFGPERGRDALACLLTEAARLRVVLIDFFCLADPLIAWFRKQGFGLQTDPALSPITWWFRPLHPAPRPAMETVIDGPGLRHSGETAFGSWYLTGGNGDMDRAAP